MGKVARWQLNQRRGQPLEIKILMSKERIRQWYSHWDGEVYVAFSGGLDSTVLLHVVRSMYPDVPAIFFNTGLEYPEIIKFVKSTDNVIFIQPKLKFHEVIKKYGYPVVSKRMAQYIHEVQRSRGETNTKHLRLTGFKTDGTFSRMGMISKKWQFLCTAPFHVSDRCCHALKKRPAKLAEKKYGAPILGIRTDESSQRTQTYYMHGCNAFNLTRPRSWPLAFWSHEDVLGYLELHDLPYSTIYDMGYTRTGCFACMFGVHMEKEPNRFQRMKTTHPKLWTYCMDKLKLRDVMEYIKVPYE